MCERVNEIFVRLTTDFRQLSMQNILDISVAKSEIPQELFVSTREAYKSLCRVKIGKTPGPDTVPNIVLKMFEFKLALVIADIYNTSLCEGYLPPLLKRASVIPVPKKCQANDIEKDIYMLFTGWEVRTGKIFCRGLKNGRGRRPRDVFET